MKSDLAIMLVGVLLIGLSFGIAIGQLAMQCDAVKHNAAHYNPKTAAFEWNEPRKETE